MRSLHPRTAKGQLARKLTGLRGEALVKGILDHDRRLRKGYNVRISTSWGKVPGMDVTLVQKACTLNPDDPRCHPVEMEVKTVEKLFEHEKSRQWPPTRESRFVLKTTENPACYVFVTEDEMTHHTVVDFVSSGRVMKWMRHLRGTKRPKLPVRAIPILRKTPCKYVSHPHVVIPRRKEV